MRKADYSALAEAIRDELTQAKAAERVERSPVTQQYHAGRATACRMIALAFVRRASVDRGAFLKACGIE